MKNMLRILALLSVFGFIVCSCNKNASIDTQDESQDVEVVPVAQAPSVEETAAKENEAKPVDENAKKEVLEKSIIIAEKGYSVEISYPELGTPAIDAFLADKAKKEADSGKKEMLNLRAEIAADEETPDYEIGMQYEIIRSTPDSADILFKHSEYTGGAHPMFAIEAVMLNGEGKVIDPWSLFENPDEELVKMSAEARKQLREKLSHFEDVDSMIHDGTEPKRENFSQMVRTNEGVRIYFSPYDIAPWSEGVLYFDYPIKH